MITNGIRLTTVGCGFERGPSHHVPIPSSSLAFHTAMYDRKTIAQVKTMTMRHCGVSSPMRASRYGVAGGGGFGGGGGSGCTSVTALHCIRQETFRDGGSAQRSRELPFRGNVRSRHHDRCTL
jgi:hypothetical protein